MRKKNKLFLKSPEKKSNKNSFQSLIIFLLAVLILASILIVESKVKAVTGDYNKDSITNNTLTASEWNNLLDDFVNQSGDTMSGVLNITKTTGDNAELQLQSVTGTDQHWGIYQDRTSEDLRFWHTDPTENNVLTVTNEGRVGIATTTPSFTLEVDGDTNIAGNLTANSITADSLASSVTAGNVSSGSFGSETGGGFYNFPSNVGIGRSASGSRLEVRRDTSGEILTLNYSGSDVFRVSDTNAVFNVPVAFNSAGDISFANNLNFTNADSAYINFQSPGHIRTESSWENLDLTLSAANAGEVVINDNLSVAGDITLSGDIYGTISSDNIEDNWVDEAGDTMTGTLNISHTGSDKITMSRGTGVARIGMTDNENSLWFDAGQDGADILINSAGNVGVGTTDPGTRKLKATGQIEATEFCIGTDCVSNWSQGTFGTFTGFTTSSYNGGQGGYAAANAICDLEYSGSHVCTTGEILYTINTGSGSSIPADSTGWVSNGPPGYTANANDCQGWESGNNADYGTVWFKLSTGDGFGSLAYCDTTYPFACCQ